MLPAHAAADTGLFSFGGVAVTYGEKDGTTAFGLHVPIVLAFLFVQKASAFGNTTLYRKDAKPQ